MLSLAKFSLSILLAAVPLAITSQQTASPTLSSALQKAHSALAGLNNPIQDIRLLGSVTYASGTTRETGLVTFLSKSDGTARIDIVVPSGTHSVLRFPFSSANASSATEPNATPQTITWPNLLIAANWFFPEHLLDILTATNRVNVVADPTQCVAGAICATSRIITPNAGEQAHNGRLSEMTVSLDPQTLLPTKLDYAVHPGPLLMPEVLIEVRYSGYQPIEGHLVPMHLQEFVNGSLRLDVQLSTVDLHENLSQAELNGAQ